MKSRFISMLHVIPLLVPGFLLLASSPTHALIDFNRNGLSDLWEKQYNSGSLFPSTFNPTLDHDGDGWNAAEEAAAGTDPNNANSPGGFLVPEMDIIPATYGTPEEPGGEPVLLTPETVTLAWPAIPGKYYILFFTDDLETWTLVGAAHGDAAGTAILHAIALTQPDGSIPPDLFFRVLTADQDHDNDRLTDTEERQLGSNPLSRFSDDDYLSDTIEVFEYGSSPADEDSNNNGVLDHDEPGLGLGGSGPGGSTYAPETYWMSYWRYLDYGAYQNGDDPPTYTGTVTTKSSWDYSPAASGGSTALTGKLPLAGLSTRLNSEVSFPSAASFTQNWYGLFRTGSYSYVEELFEFAHIEHVQTRLRADRAPLENLKRELMVVRYGSTASSADDILGIEAQSFTIPGGGFKSPPEVFGDDFTPSTEAYDRTEFRATEIVCDRTTDPAGELLWDNTGTRPWYPLGTNPGITGSYTDSVPASLRDRLEVAVADGDNTHLLLYNNSSTQGTFSVVGTSPTGSGGAELQLRLKTDPAAIFAKVKFHVLQRRDVQVSIFRIHDSRVPASAVGAGISDTVILQKLNDTFRTRGNIYFTLRNSVAVDLRRGKNAPASDPDLPLLFSSNGALNPDNYVVAVTDRTNLESPAKLTIHILENLDRNGDVGVTYENRNTCFVDSAEDWLVYAHEVGHILSLAAKPTTTGTGRHDSGPWPSEFAVPQKTGLMFNNKHPNETNWLRREDWWKANDKARQLE